MPLTTNLSGPTTPPSRAIPSRSSTFTASPETRTRLPSWGTFALDSTGNILFTAAVPEPSTYALLGLGGIAAIGALMRRRARLAAA
ncbi:MAG: PEP-CTERM sorting domain-containing protein [Chthoniobacterales bacterium]